MEISLLKMSFITGQLLLSFLRFFFFFPEAYLKILTPERHILGWHILFEFLSVAQLVKNLPAMQETQVWSLGVEDPLEKGMATHSSILAWRIPGMEEPRGLPSVGSHRVGHDWSSLAAAADIESPEYSGAISAHSEIQLIYQICEIAFKHCDWNEGDSSNLSIFPSSSATRFNLETEWKNNYPRLRELDRVIFVWLMDLVCI